MTHLQRLSPIFMRQCHPDSPSPPRKRMRLSSPTFDDQVGELSQDDINAFDCLDAQLSQADPSRTRHSSRLGQASALNTLAQDTYMEDKENPFRTNDRGWTTADAPKSERIHVPFMKASAIHKTAEPLQFTEEPSNDRDVEDEAPPEVDYATWFNSDTSNSFVGFNTAATALPGFQRPSMDGEKSKAFLIPSAAALREAQEKMKTWQGDEPPPDHAASQEKEPVALHANQPSSPPPTLFSSARNAFSLNHVPDTPTPAPPLRSTTVEVLHAKSNRSFQSLGKQSIKPFKSPFIATTSSHLSHRLAAAPNASSPLRIYQPTDSVPSQISSTPKSISPLRPSSAANHIMSQKPLGFTPRRGGALTRPKFVTPFKAAAKPNDPKASALRGKSSALTPMHSGMIVNRTYPPSIQSLPQNRKMRNDGRVFDLTPPPGRRKLVTSGLRPQGHSAKELENMGINYKEISRINLQTALFYAFTTRERSPRSPSDPSSSPLGHSTALEELHARGCVLATRAWVENHWPLVLWKLAGMVALDPTSESDLSMKRWCWPEVIRQLMYRYERDLNNSSRPPLRLITTRDASAESPMVLCVSDIIWPTGPSEGDTSSAPSLPELELTDGWYRLRARIDAPLARAVTKGKIKLGRKIAVAGAKLSAERKEGCEILEAYNSNALLLTGNSSHLAPWHAKLGFQRGPFIATLNSLTADGGNIAVMLLSVIKAFPVAYLEFVQDADGRKRREGPRDAKEELKLSVQWKAKRESHSAKLWSQSESRRCRMLDYADRLQQRAGSRFHPRDEGRQATGAPRVTDIDAQTDGPPDKIYDFYDTLLEDPEAAKGIMSSISHDEAGWLARHIRVKAERERDEVSREIEQELESLCPPRDVKAFCVLVVKDARTHKYPSNRSAQVTVWDVPGMSLAEGSTENSFAPGQRYLATNLLPTSCSAWMDRSSGAEVYLTARKNSKWTRIN